MHIRFALLLAALSGLCLTAQGALADYHQNNRSRCDGELLQGEVFPKRHRHKRLCDGYRYVYAESWYGFKSIVAPVRRAELGDQVRLPGGTWVYCEYSCEYTLRKQSLDFWDGSSGPGDNVSPRRLYWEFGF